MFRPSQTQFYLTYGFSVSAPYKVTSQILLFLVILLSKLKLSNLGSQFREICVSIMFKYNLMNFQSILWSSLINISPLLVFPIFLINTILLQSLPTWVIKKRTRFNLYWVWCPWLFNFLLVNVSSAYISTVANIAMSILCT